MDEPDRPRDETSANLSSTLRRNIAALRRLRREEASSIDVQDKIANAITAFAGSMRFVYLHLAIYGSWIVVNTVPGLPHFDPSYVMLAMAASVEAIFLSTFVLISQNRAMATTDKRDDLDLHINLLAEHELTTLIKLVTAIADKLEVDHEIADELPEVTKDVAPEDVLREIRK
ncbi:putative membrane protein [Rhodopseudomonas thermotolerans]|uniref:Membrane protein n=2 Tax=Rhodopseudomonas TaxID=1073 RepID=A0A336JP23_9BRAD|nr:MULTISPECIES: DUF1003 domain-containing protein [Rhodopseudomonas]RED33264.1 putative membrane protein [Rhodopseudomonas pentothenatexigens]REF94013.1 putative membrane protein [Rhodopseudomonas thermotolerans]SSW91340.1 uncharacterized membrane protein [Rhodopseudomonas pentothenatexigens]